MSLSSYLTCNMVPRREVAVSDDDDDDGPQPQPQTATCCTALQRGLAPDSRVQPRYAPVRTPASAALLQQVLVDGEEDGQTKKKINNKKKMIVAGNATTTPTAKAAMDDDDEKKMKMMMMPNRKAVRKCKSTVENVDLSRFMEAAAGAPPLPQLRRSGGVRRDWSFENLNKAA